LNRHVKAGEGRWQAVMAWRTAPFPNHDEITNYGCLVMYSSHNIMFDNGFFLSAKTDTDIITAGKKVSVCR
jgi:hypothetical protein